MLGAKGSGRGGYDINKRGDGRVSPYQKQAGQNDLYCNRCGMCLHNQLFLRRSTCPGCKANIPLADGWGFNDWGRCGGCWQYTHNDFAFCQMCGRGNNGTIARQLRDKAKEVENIRQQEQVKIENLQKLNSEKDEEIRKLLEIVAAQEKAHFDSLKDDDFADEIMELELSAGISQKSSETENLDGKTGGTPVSKTVDSPVATADTQDDNAEF